MRRADVSLRDVGLDDSQRWVTPRWFLALTFDIETCLLTLDEDPCAREQTDGRFLKWLVEFGPHGLMIELRSNFVHRSECSWQKCVAVDAHGLERNKRPAKPSEFRLAAARPSASTSRPSY